MSTLALQIPVEIPAPERIEQLIREAAREVAREKSRWLDFNAAAEYLSVSRRTFDRWRQTGGPLETLPVSELTDTAKLVAQEDLDTLLAARLVTRGGKILDFPSLERRRDAIDPQKPQQKATGAPGESWERWPGENAPQNPQQKGAA